MKRIAFLFSLILILLPAQAGKKIKVACVGNSVTFGMTLPERETQCYPYRLQQMLGTNYEVRNFGHSGTTLIRNGYRPYHKQQEYTDALSFKADWVIIHLGLNDTDPRVWPNLSDDFNADYIQLINDFKTANPKAKVWICLMTPIFDRHHRFESGTRDWHAMIQQHIKQVADATHVGLIDLNSPLCNRPELFADALHPNAEGADIIAKTVYGNLTGNYGGLQTSPLYTDGMVVQRRQPIVFRGTANAGETVQVKFDGQSRTTTADVYGQWEATFGAMEAGGPYKAEIKAKSGKKTISNLYVGEVWLCSGQSNMEFPVSATLTAKADLENAGAQPLVHLFNMPAIYPTSAVKWSPAACDSVNRHQYQHIGPWTACTPQTVAGFSAVAYHFGKTLADSLQVPVGIVCNAVGGTTTESWIDRRTLEWEFPAVLRNWYHGDFGQPWARERALYNISNTTNKLQRHPYEPAYMFESGIMPLKNYAFQGVVWYQGESNAHNVELHERLFPLMQKSWRAFFGNPKLPFYFVQLSSLNRPSWPAFRNSQRQMAERLPDTRMVVSSDLGDSTDVHYRNKQPVGYRLALQALHHSYGFNLISEGPVCTKAVVEGKGVRLQFGQATQLQAQKAPLTGFEIAGADGIFHRAEAQISEKTTVVVSCPEVARPVKVRYAWQPFTRANLVNERGLPCSTFEKEIEQ